MSYPGNPSLAQDVQARIASTFQQTLDLVERGSEQEAKAGCEFILRMDSDYTPAQALITRLDRPDRPVPLDDLRTAPVAASELDALDDLSGFEELGTLDDLDAGTAPAPPESLQATSGLAKMIHDLLERRNFEQIAQIAESQKEAIARDPEAQSLIETAGSRQESDVYVKAFLSSARQAREAGQLDEMAAHLAKARALDADHPEVLAFEDPPPPADDDVLTFSTVDDPPLMPTAEPAFEASALEEPQFEAPQLEEPQFEAPQFEEPQFEKTELEEPQLGNAAISQDADFDLGVSLPPGVPEPDLSAELQDAGEPAPEAAPDSGESRIDQLLDEGQEIFERGEYQSAIDVWSRIFLIDIENAEASQRIEEARGKKAELERQAEEIFHQGTGQVEEGSLEEAQESFRRVLELQPGHSLAREYLEQLEAGQVPVVTRGGDPESVDTEGFEDLAGDAEASGASPSLEAAVERDRVVVVKKVDKRMIALGAAVAVLVLGGVFFLTTQWNDLFPNQDEAPPVVHQSDPLERATQLHEEGDTETALVILRRVLPDDPSYQNAQALIAQWEAAAQAVPEEEEPSGPSEEQLRRHALLLAAAREAHAQGRHIRAQRYFERAGKIMPLPTGDLALKSQSDEAIKPLAAEISLFNDGEYTQVIPVLWRKRDAAPDSADIELLLVDSYYNLALTDLQRNNASGAAQKLADALEVRPDSLDLQRMRLFAQTYVDREPDLLYRIYVKYLPSR